MMRTYLVVEGRSEERFARAVLAPHLANHNVALYVMTIPVGGGRRGGGRRWKRWHRFLSRLLKELRGDQVRVTTLLDAWVTELEALGEVQP